MTSSAKPAPWFYARGGEQFGPVSASDLKRMAATGRLRHDDLVWQEGTTGWRAAGQLKGLKFKAESEDPPVTGTEVSPSEETATARLVKELHFIDPEGGRIRSGTVSLVEQLAEGKVRVHFSHPPDLRDSPRVMADRAYASGIRQRFEGQGKPESADGEAVTSEEADSQWWHVRDGRQVGPLSTNNLRRMAANGQLKQDDLIWKAGQADWQPAGQVKSLEFQSIAEQTGARETPRPLAKTPSSNPQTSPPKGGSNFGWPVWLPVILSCIAYFTYQQQAQYREHQQRMTAARRMADGSSPFARRSGERGFNFRPSRSLPPADDTSAKGHFDRGVAHANRGELDEAIAEFSRSIETDPAVPDPYGNRGIAFAAKGELDRAIADFDEAIRCDPQYAPAYYGRGTIRMTKGDDVRAISDFTKAIEQDPHLVNALLNRGAAYMNIGSLSEAIADFSEVIRREPDHALAYYHRGMTFEARGDVSRAEADYAKARELDPDIGE